MNQSRYNVAIESGPHEHAVYNIANGAFVALDDEAWSAYQQADGPMPSNDDAVDRLLSLGILTDLSPAEELAALQARIDQGRLDEHALRLSLVPTYACNYKCPYCYEDAPGRIKGKMDCEVMDAVMTFIETQFQEREASGATPFDSLSVQWYGGDPTLALDVVERLSERMIDWCKERGHAYSALMLTNANIIDEHEAQVIRDCRISNVLLTIDGPEELHNRRRVAANGSNSYQRTLHAARLLRAHGVGLEATMNVDRISWPLYAQTRDRLWAEEGIPLVAGRLCNYKQNFGQGAFAPPDFDLFEHSEFCQAKFDLFASEHHDANEMRALLEPNIRFCSGQSGAYFVIDLKGDVYHCDGLVGYPEHVRFNILDDPETWKPSEITFDATRDEKCGECEQLPLCLGSCIWERSLTGMPCYPLKDTLPGYLRIYRESLCDAEPGTGGVAVLAEPFDRIEALRFGGAEGSSRR